MGDDIVAADIDASLQVGDGIVQEAEAAHLAVYTKVIVSDRKVNMDHLEPLREGLALFRKRARIALRKH